jgi:hypothetical protein
MSAIGTAGVGLFSALLGQKQAEETAAANLAIQQANLRERQKDRQFAAEQDIIQKVGGVGQAQAAGLAGQSSALSRLASLFGGVS